MLASRTLQPLHFEDLDPKRFEDLVRQLVYDFRVWYSLEAMGRAGADEGIDILATERLSVDTVASEEEEDEGEATLRNVDRQWIIQCKREKAIPPRRIAEYVAQSLQGKTEVHGFMLVTSADLSKKSRDAFRAAVRTFGIEESYVWSRAELEDLLVAPRNDHLLFAYFGFSLQVRRRSRQSEIAAQIALKRKLTKVLPLRPSGYHTILLRDADAPNYPFINDFGAFAKRPRWKYYECSGHLPPGYLQVALRQTIGWADVEKGTWDIPNFRPFLPANHQLYGVPDDLWKQEQDELEKLTSSVPEDRRATIKVYGYVPYERIVAVDDIGDAYNQGAHLLVQYDPEFAFFDPEMFTVMLVRGNYIPDVRLEERNRIAFFPWPAPA